VNAQLPVYFFFSFPLIPLFPLFISIRLAIAKASGERSSSSAVRAKPASQTTFGAFWDEKVLQFSRMFTKNCQS